MSNKNYKKHLPVFGVGPIYVAIIISLTAIGILLVQSKIIDSGKVDFLALPFTVVGSLMIIEGFVIWGAANLHSKLGKCIVENKLITTGVYAFVRNPCYSAFMLFCTAAILFVHNLWLLILPFVFWAFLTILMKQTEEKWLTDLYGQQYTDYCKKVNRCIPMFSVKIK